MQFVFSMCLCDAAGVAFLAHSIHLLFALFAALLLGTLTIKPDLELDHVRSRINQMVCDKPGTNRLDASDDSMAHSTDSDFKERYRIENTLSLSPEWCFVDCK